jgi:hypothetical protein
VFTVQINVYAQASSLLSTGDADVVVAGSHHWKPAEDYVAVSATFQLPVLSQAEIQAKLARNEMRLIVLIFLPLNTVNFLHGYDVGIKLAQHFNYAFRAQAAINSHAFMNVVSGNSKLFYFPH